MGPRLRGDDTEVVEAPSIASYVDNA